MGANDYVIKHGRDTKTGEMRFYAYHRQTGRRVAEAQYVPESGQYIVLEKWMLDGKSHSAPLKNGSVGSRQKQRDAEEAERRMATGE